MKEEITGNLESGSIINNKNSGARRLLPLKGSDLGMVSKHEVTITGQRTAYGRTLNAIRVFSGQKVHEAIVGSALD